jgi:bleomycin hydrolase
MVRLRWLVVASGLVLGSCGIALGQEAGVDGGTIEKVRSEFQMDAATRAMRNALTGADIREIAQDRQIVAGHNDTFSHKIKTKGISNQKSSGRCWMFAGFNTIKPMLMDKLDLDSFEFSHIYLQFWDKFEKANTFLQAMIDFRDRDLMDREVVFLLKDPCPDGGYWENFVDLVDKYGVMPKEAMAESASSENTGMMNRILSRILRKDAVELRDIYTATGSVRQMEQAKERMLKEVYRALVLNLGEPPQQFAWRYKVKDAKGQADAPADETGQEKKDAKGDYEVQQKWSERRLFTPKSFYDEFVGVDLRQYVNLTHDPIRPRGGHYEIQLTRNLYGGQNASYVTVGIETLKEIVTKVLLDNKAVYFAADVSPDQDSKKGIMARGLYDYESIYGIDMGLNKTDRILFRDSTINHGMAFIGVDLVEGRPVKWLVENSWGSDRGAGGLWTMYDDWFIDNVYNVIVHSDYVPREVLAVFEQPATKLPVWDPMW